MRLKRSSQRHSLKQRNGRRLQALCFATSAVLCAPMALQAQINKAPDIKKAPTLYVVPYAHLDTQWRWEMPQTISEYLFKTLHVNFDYIEKYPHYVFNWTGSNRYRLMKEYFPDDYARMGKYIAAGRWFPAGSSVEEGDVNLPSAEAILRQVLYGNGYYRREFGKASNEYMIPDCFGFPASLPAILAHAGVKGFSTQKLNASWQPAPKVGGAGSPEDTPEGIPFNVGIWEGPDGSKVLAALNPSSYNSNTYTDLSKENPPLAPPKVSPEEMATLTEQQQRVVTHARDIEPDWVKRIDLDGKVTGVYADYHYVGTGDIGGATQEFTVKLLDAIASKSETVLPMPPRPRFLKPVAEEAGRPVRVGEGPVNVIMTEADQLFNDVKPDMQARMPSYKGDLELINHSAGSLTSQAYHKRWVVRNELLATAAEESSIGAQLLGGLPYQQKRMNDAWILALGGHFHDTAAGTATPRTYEFAWNDDTIVANQFAGVLTSATEAVAAGLNTQGVGTPLVVFNALNVDREDLVEAILPAGMKSARVKGPDGKDLATQVEDGKVLFSAKTPSVGYAVFDLQPDSGASQKSAVQVTANSLENARYKVQLNGDGDVSSVFDKSLNRELLSAPIRFDLSNDNPKQWPAWNMDFDQEQAAPIGYVSGPAKIRIKESGPVRVSLEVTREAAGSKFVQTISLSAGDAGNRVEFGNKIDWRSKSVNLKVAFPLSASNPNATYNEDVGTIQRPNAFDRQFEVMSHRWIDLTDASGSFGATILTDVKNASDKPSDNTIRLTLLRTPGLQPTTNGRPAAYSDEANQDWGHHEFSFGLIGHAGDWRKAQTDWQAYRLNDPLRAFVTTKHTGALGKSLSLVNVSNSRVRVMALKKAEESDETILRIVELDGKPASDVKVKFAGPVTAVREVNGQELPLDHASASLVDGALVTSLHGYQPKTFALKLGAMPSARQTTHSQPVPLQYDLAAASNDDVKASGAGMDSKGDAYPAEMLPAVLSLGGVDFRLGPAQAKAPNALIATGQTISLPEGNYNRVYILAASVDGDQATQFKVGSTQVPLNIQNWGGFVGQWDTRVWKTPPQRDWAISAHHAVWPPVDFKEREPAPPSPVYPDDYVSLTPGFIKPAQIAWYASHFHTPDGLNQPYQYSYLFSYALDLPASARTITLPKNDKVRIFAVSVANESPAVTAAQPLSDTLDYPASIRQE